jgi:hypothetical protein
MGVGDGLFGFDRCGFLNRLIQGIAAKAAPTIPGFDKVL